MNPLSFGSWLLGLGDPSRLKTLPPAGPSFGVDDIDVSRGDMICRPGNQPDVSQDIDAMICWMAETETMHPNKKYILKHTTRRVRALVKNLEYA